MGIKKKYQIDDDTWQKLQKMYFVGFLLCSPFLTFGFTFMVWAVTDGVVNGYSWIFFTSLPWAIIYLVALLMANLFFKRSKYSIFVRLLFVILIWYFFVALASACVFRLFGNVWLVINSIFLFVSGIFCFRHYCKHWDKVWNSHSFYNENTIIDQENARFDYLNGFNIDENKLNKKAGKKDSNPALIALISSIAPIYVGIGLIFSKFGMYSIVAIIGWIGATYTALGFMKGVAAYFYNYRKLAYFEKKLGKPIINGILDS